MDRVIDISSILIFFVFVLPKSAAILFIFRVRVAAIYSASQSSHLQANLASRLYHGSSSRVSYYFFNFRYANYTASSVANRGCHTRDPLYNTATRTRTSLTALTACAASGKKIAQSGGGGGKITAVGLA